MYTSYSNPLVSGPQKESWGRAIWKTWKRQCWSAAQHAKNPLFNIISMSVIFKVSL